MPIIVKDGLLQYATEHIIGHQVNGLGVMGAGVARDIKSNFPHAFRSYQSYVRNHPTPDSLLGKNLMVAPPGQELYTYDTSCGEPIIANLFGQARISRTEKMTDYTAIRSALQHLKGFAQIYGLSVALPYKIGCNLGGGDWDTVEAIIRDVFHDYPVTLYRKR